jgi:hypothetical protein
MRGLALGLSYAALCAAVVAGAGFVVPAMRSAPGAIAAPSSAAAVASASVADDDIDLQMHRLSERARAETTLAGSRPPVPFLPSPKQVFVPAAEADPAMEQSPAVLRPPQAEAKSLIEADGYKGVRLLVREPDGRWRAMAMRGTTEVAVLVDDKGNVSSQ